MIKFFFIWMVMVGLIFMVGLSRRRIESDSNFLPRVKEGAVDARPVCLLPLPFFWPPFSCGEDDWETGRGSR